MATLFLIGSFHRITRMMAGHPRDFTLPASRATRRLTRMRVMWVVLPAVAPHLARSWPSLHSPHSARSALYRNPSTLSAIHQRNIWSLLDQYKIDSKTVQPLFHFELQPRAPQPFGAIHSARPSPPRTFPGRRRPVHTAPYYYHGNRRVHLSILRLGLQSKEKKMLDTPQWQAV